MTLNLKQQNNFNFEISHCENTCNVFCDLQAQYEVPFHARLSVYPYKPVKQVKSKCIPKVSLFHKRTILEKCLTLLDNKIRPTLTMPKALCQKLMMCWWRLSIRGNIIIEVTSSTKHTNLDIMVNLYDIYTNINIDSSTNTNTITQKYTVYQGKHYH